MESTCLSAARDSGLRPNLLAHAAVGFLARGMSTKVALVALAAYFGAPLLFPCSAPGSLDAIASWAMKGPAKDLPAAMNGVFAFRGVNPAFLMDTSYSHSWNPKTRSFVLDVPKAILYDTEATASQFTGEFASKSRTLDLPGKLLSLMNRMLHASLKFTFNEDFTEATLEPALVSRWFPLNGWATRILSEKAIAHKGGWKRVNFVPPSNSTPTSDTYFLQPVVTRKADGSLKVHNDGLKLAKRKLAMGSGAFAQC